MLNPLVVVPIYLQQLFCCLQQLFCCLQQSLSAANVCPEKKINANKAITVANFFMIDLLYRLNCLKKN
jgi:hypothetical protein